MATISGQVTSYDNTVPQKRVVTDRIIMADPYDITTINVLGLNNESKFQFKNTPGRSYEWIEDAYPAVSAPAAATNITNDSTTTTIAFSAANSKLFKIGDVVQLDSEYVWVSAVNTTTGVVTATRNYGGTQATHASTVTAYIRYSARLEGAASDVSPFVEASTNYNYSTIFQKDINITRTDQLIKNYGMGNILDREIDKNMDVLMERLNRLPYYGQRQVGTASAARSSGGFGTFVTTNATALASAALTRKNLDDTFQTIYAAGGHTSLILCDAWGQRKINDFYEDFVQTARDESIGGVLIKQLMHPITGSLCKVVVDRHVPAGSMYFLDQRYVGYISIDPFFHEDLAKSGDYDLSQVVGEYGFVCAYNKSHGALTGYSTSS